MKYILKSIPAWIYTLILGILIGLGIYFFVSFERKVDLPASQILFSGKTYTTSYNLKTKTPIWVLQTLSSNDFLEDHEYKFMANPDLPANLTSYPMDYKSSGYEILNLVTLTKLDDLEPTFYLSNACPQNAQLNQGYWKKVNAYVENLIRKNEKALVLSGPLYLSQETSEKKREIPIIVIGKNEVAVPTHFFKIIATSAKKMEIYVIPNKEIDESTDLDSFRVPICDFERDSGIILPKNIGEYFFLQAPMGELK